MWIIVEVLISDKHSHLFLSWLSVHCSVPMLCRGRRYRCKKKKAESASVDAGVVCRTCRSLRGHAGVRPAATNLPLFCLFWHFFYFLCWSQNVARRSARRRHFPQKAGVGKRTSGKLSPWQHRTRRCRLGTLTSCHVEIGRRQISCLSGQGLNFNLFSFFLSAFLVVERKNVRSVFC